MALVGRALALLLVGVLLTACVLESTAPVREAGSPTASSGGASAAASSSAKPVPSSTGAGSQAGTGIVSGQIERLDGTPLKGIIVYAAPVELHGERRLASVDPLLDPHTVTDALGKFQIKSLRAGEHVLATQSPLGIILPHSKEGQVVTFRIAADQETKLGLLQVGYAYPDGD